MLLTVGWLIGIISDAKYPTSVYWFTVTTPLGLQINAVFTDSESPTIAPVYEYPIENLRGGSVREHTHTHIIIIIVNNNNINNKSSSNKSIMLPPLSLTMPASSTPP